MDTTEQRRHVRLRRSFPVSLRKEGLEQWVEGASANVSQRGAFIVTDKWHLFRVHDRIVIIWILPSEFTGQSGAVRLIGEAVVRRVDRESGGVALECMKSFRTFERINGQTYTEASGLHRQEPLS